MSNKDQIIRAIQSGDMETAQRLVMREASGAKVMHHYGVELGQNIYVTAIPYHYIGQVVGGNEHFLRLEKVTRVFNTPDTDEVWGSGSALDESSSVKKWKDLNLQRNAISDCVVYPHDLPKYSDE